MLKKHVILFLFVALAASKISSSQEIEMFTVEDFDLKGNVKSCFVITDYGKEEYYFDKSQRLIKSITRFNDNDYEITYYKYSNGGLAERRVENYLDNTFDGITSIANFYVLDTVPNRKITEKIVSYKKELLEQNIYNYDEDGKLTKIDRTDSDGTDAFTFTYNESDGEKVVIQERNGVLYEIVQTTRSTSANDSLQQTIRTQKYLDGQLNIKTQEVFDGEGKLISRTKALYDSSTEKWIPQEDHTYFYAENGVLSQLRSKKRGFTTTKEYIYQFDGTEANNWVKEIVTPDNTYKTRRIKYYEMPAVAQDSIKE